MLKKLTTFLLMLTLSVGAVWADEFDDANAAKVRGDYRSAYSFYVAAAAKGNARAQYELAVLYRNGSGVIVDYKEALKWYRLSAAQGYADAQTNIGLMYQMGEGVAQNFILAHMWLNLAATTGETYKVYFRDTLSTKMTQQQIAEAQKLARECQARNFKNCD